MPEPGWNPYRWVRVPDRPIDRKPPRYHHRLDGLAGRFDCTLEALTPLIICDEGAIGPGGKRTYQFQGLGLKQRGRPVIPGTSLKGMVRSLVELIGNACVPFEKGHADGLHEFGNAATGSADLGTWELDVAARMFGYLNRRQAFAGLVHFGDAAMVDSPVDPPRWPGMEIAVGQPKPEHRSFYPPNQDVRKLYHHNPDTPELTRPQANIRQVNILHPAPPGTTFRFRVDFRNLRTEELALLTYALVLEERVTVTLSNAALAPDATGPVTLTGPLRHKLGRAKAQGGGSARIVVDALRIEGDPAARYRSGGDAAERLAGAALDARIAALVHPIATRADPTMQELRAMMIYDPGDPRASRLDYPSYAWFQADRQQPPATKARLKPIL
jgi:CRISPR/Cas system CSM-associated protein Csm3 (group 7 of RAMP superfamily)